MWDLRVVIGILAYILRNCTIYSYLCSHAVLCVCSRQIFLAGILYGMHERRMGTNVALQRVSDFARSMH